MKCNTNYRESYKYDPMPEREERKSYPPPSHPHHKHEVTILRCGTSIGSTPVNCTGLVLDGGGSGCYPTVLATVTLDTREVIDPTVKIDFSSLISFKTSSDYNYLLRLVFKLSKVCDGCPIPLGTWTFEECQYPGAAIAQTDGGYVQETESFSFSWCNCDNCPGCCRYIVELVDQQCYNIDFAVVSNISLAALAVGLMKDK